MIDPREPVSALLELATQATTEGVRETALRRITALADAELDRARGAANSLAMREALRPAVYSLSRHSVVASLLNGRDEDGARTGNHEQRDSANHFVNRFLRNTLTLGAPAVHRSSVTIDIRGSRCGRMLASASPAEFAHATRDAGCLVCAVLLRDLDRATARGFLEILGSARTSLGRLAQFVPAPDEGLARWTLELVRALGPVHRSESLATIGGSLVRSLTIWMELDVAAALQRRLGGKAANTSPTPRGWLDSVVRLIGVNDS